MDKGKERRIRELIDLIPNHSGEQAYGEWESLRRVYSAYLRNEADLLRLIDLPNTNQTVGRSMAHNQDGEDARAAFFDELFRLLHNCLSSVTTLIDHTRNLTRRYERTSFYFEYDNRRVKVAGAAAATFLKDLRNYLVHHRMVPMVITFRVRQEPIPDPFMVTLDAKKLLERGQWSSASKALLRTTKSVVLRDCVEEYTQRIRGLYEWMFGQFEQLHGKDLDDLNALKDELRELIGPIPGEDMLARG